MRDHAVMALIGGRGRHHDHLALGLGQAAVLLHQRVVIGKERAKLVGTIGQGQEDIRDEAGLLLHRQDPGADIIWQFVEGWRRETFGDGLRHGGVPAGAARRLRRDHNRPPRRCKARRSSRRVRGQRSGFFSSEKRSGSSPSDGCSIGASSGMARATGRSLTVGSLGPSRCEVAPRQRSSTAETKCMS